MEASWTLLQPFLEFWHIKRHVFSKILPANSWWTSSLISLYFGLFISHNIFIFFKHSSSGYETSLSLTYEHRFVRIHLFVFKNWKNSCQICQLNWLKIKWFRKCGLLERSSKGHQLHALMSSWWKVSINFQISMTIFLFYFIICSKLYFEEISRNW